jgi:hypothetical protein
MSAIPWSMDASSKRWLAALGVVALVSLSILTRSFCIVLFPTKPEPVAAQTSTPAREAVARTEPAWNTTTPSRSAEDPQDTPPRVSPFAAQEAAAAAAKAHELSAQQAVHRQAEYLRNLISQGKLPQGFGNLTKEQVDEMEKKGITIN